MLFCEIHPICYEISLKKEICKRHIKDYLSDIKFAKTKSDKWLPNVVTGYSCNLIKRGLACDKIDGLLIRPGEMFSFWHTVGKTTKKKGYKDGRVIIHNKLIPGLGGGLCNFYTVPYRLRSSIIIPMRWLRKKGKECRSVPGLLSATITSITVL